MSDSALEVRNDVLAHLRTHHPDICRHWFDDIQAYDFEGGMLRLVVPERVQLNYLRRNCLDEFNSAAQAVTDRLVAVKFLSPEEARSIEAERAAARRSANESSARLEGEPHAYDEMLICPDYTFDQFVQGPGNRLALAAAMAVAEKPGESYNPFFVHGGVGLGKTHLLQAICQTIMREAPDTRIYYISCESFTSQFMHAVRQGQMSDFRHRFRNVDVLMIDDVHFFSKREQSQEEFFHTFNTLYQARKQIVLSSDAAPNDIPDLEERLVSRFNSGLVAQIEKPSYETRVSIVKMKAGLRNMDLPDEVAAYIASKIDSNIRELEGAITKLGMLSRLEKAPIDLVLAKEAMGKHGPGESNRQPSVQHIIEVVCDYYDVKLTEILSKRKYKSIAQPRQICMWLARRLTRYSLEEIGGYFGGRDHTTVLHAIKAIDVRQGTDERLAGDIAHLRASLERPPGH